MTTIHTKLRAFSALMMRSMRVLAYVAFVSVVAGGLMLRVAYGQAKKAGMAMGDDLVRLTSTGAMADVYVLKINGEEASVSSAMTDAPIEDVLSRMQEACATHADGLQKSFESLTASMRPGNALSDVGVPGLGVAREQQDDRGFVVCFAQETTPTKSAWLEKMRLFAETGDLGKIGALRYVMAQRTPGDRTHVVAVWTGARFSLKAAFPNHGDAPGSDAREVPRPDGRRVLTAVAQGAPYAIRAYELDRGVDETLRRYDAEMPKLGWQAMPQAAKGVPTARAYHRGDVDLLVSTEPHGGKTLLQIIEMGRAQP